MRILPFLTRSVCILLFLFAGFLADSHAAPTKNVKRVFQYTVRQGPNGDPNNALVVTGTLDIKYNTEDGTLTGKLIPARNDDTGEDLNSVVFRRTPSGLVSQNVPSLKVRGQVSGHSANLVILDVAGPGNHVYATGTTEKSTGRKGKFQKDPGEALGWAVGPEQGDAGNFGYRVTVIVIRFSDGQTTTTITIVIRTK